MAPCFRRGQHVTVDINGEHVEAVFVRPAEKQYGIDPANVPGGDVSVIGWVQRVGSEDIEGYLLERSAPSRMLMSGSQLAGPTRSCKRSAAQQPWLSRMTFE